MAHILSAVQTVWAYRRDMKTHRLNRTI